MTIANHNNARSCFKQSEKGEDILVGAEFLCYVPDFSIGIHVLTYGFNREQEKILNKKKRPLRLSTLCERTKHTCDLGSPSLFLFIKRRQKNWLAGREIGLKRKNILLTEQWAGQSFRQIALKQKTSLDDNKRLKFFESDKNPKYLRLYE